jgi:hypothetical protein
LLNLRAENHETGRFQAVMLRIMKDVQPITLDRYSLENYT